MLHQHRYLVQAFTCCTMLAIAGAAQAATTITPDAAPTAAETAVGQRSFSADERVSDQPQALGQHHVLKVAAALRAIVIAAAFPGMAATPGVVAAATPITGQIGFYSDTANPIRSTFTQTTATPEVRPSKVALAERDAVVLEDLRWSGWGTSVARATGFRSVWVCTTSCADGKYVKQPARVTLTLTKPGVVLGHMVYRCYQIDPTDSRDDPVDHGCLHPVGAGGLYDYE